MSALIPLTLFCSYLEPDLCCESPLFITFEGFPTVYEQYSSLGLHKFTKDKPMCRRLNLIRYKSCGCELFEHEPQYCPEIIKAQGGPRPGPWIRTVVIGREYETQMPNLSSEDNFQVCQDGYLHRVVTQHSYRDLLWPRCQGEVFSKGFIRNKCPWHDWLLMEEREWTKQEAARRRIKATREMAKKKQEEWEQSLLGKGEKILKKITQPNKPDEPNWKPRTLRKYAR